jgi:uncharacterized protein (TIGR03086 family)
MRHDPGLAASPPVRYRLEMEGDRSGTPLFLRPQLTCTCAGNWVATGANPASSITPDCGSPLRSSRAEPACVAGLPGEILCHMVLNGFVRALDGFEAALAGVGPGRWGAPSPCANWSAADVAGHVIGGLRETEALARGRYTGDRADDPGSAAGDDPLGAWRAARADMMAALDPVALARLVPGPWGQMPLGEILERSPMEFLVHAWDLAQATGQAVMLDQGLVRDALGPARQFALLARLTNLVGPECAVTEDADDLTRLLAIFGRRNPDD